MPATNMKNGCRIRSILLFPVFILAVFPFLSGYWASGACFASDASPAVRAGSELDFRPYAYTDEDGRPTGFGVELLKAVAKKMGLTIRFTPGPWDEVWNGLVAGTIDVLPVVARTPGREPLVDFSLPHTETFDAFFVREGGPELPDLSAAAGREIVVLRSDAAHHELVERKFAGKVIPVESIPEGLRRIAAGRHDAMLCSKLVGVLELGQAGIKGVQPGPPIPDYKRVFSFAVRKGDADLLEKLNQGLRIVKATGEYERIYQKWLAGEDPWRRWLPYFRWALAGFVVLGVLVATLQWLVRKRTRELARARDALQELNATLEERVAERTAALRESEERLGRAQEIAHVGSWELDLVRNRLTWSDEAYRIFGLQPREFGVTYEAFLECVHPDDRRTVDDAYSESLRANRDTYEVEHRVVRKDTGEIRLVHEKCEHLRDGAGKIVRSVGMVHDITENRLAKQRLALDLETMTRLQKLGTIFVHERNLESVFHEIVDAAIAITDADFGNIQLLDSSTGDLRIVAQRGFPQWWLDHWNAVTRGQGACGTALERGERLVVEDVERSPIFIGTPALDIQRRAGVRAVQSTPLTGRSGTPLGMFSTHYRTPRQIDERALRLLDLLARQAADMIERARAEESLRYRNVTLGGINRILREALAGSSEAEFARSCLAVAEEVTRSGLGFIGEIGRDGLLHDIAISDPGRETRSKSDKAGHLRAPGDVRFHGLEGRVILDGKGFYSNDPASHPDSIGTPDGQTPITAFIGAPMVQSGKTIGVLALANRKGGYCDEDLEVVQALAGVIVQALMHARAEEALRTSLADKDVLMRELAHRTKNNMQVIASLLGLQAAALGDKKLVDALADTQERIRAMALVHENLYQSGNIASLDIKDYVEDLVNSLLRAHRVTGRTIRSNLDIEDLYLSIDAALPSGLIINELVSNSLKHAFHGEKSGEIFISLRRIGNDVELRYRDDGPGLPRDLDVSRQTSLGLKLVHNLAVRQLRGTMEIRHEPVSEFVFAFSGFAREERT